MLKIYLERRGYMNKIFYLNSLLLISSTALCMEESSKAPKGHHSPFKQKALKWAKETKSPTLSKVYTSVVTEKSPTKHAIRGEKAEASGLEGEAIKHFTRAAQAQPSYASESKYKAAKKCLANAMAEAETTRIDIRAHESTIELYTKHTAEALRFFQELCSAAKALSKDHEEDNTTNYYSEIKDEFIKFKEFIDESQESLEKYIDENEKQKINTFFEKDLAIFSNDAKIYLNSIFPESTYKAAKQSLAKAMADADMSRIDIPTRKSTIDSYKKHTAQALVLFHKLCNVARALAKDQPEDSNTNYRSELIEEFKKFKEFIEDTKKSLKDYLSEANKQNLNTFFKEDLVLFNQNAENYVDSFFEESTR